MVYGWHSGPLEPCLHPSLKLTCVSRAKETGPARTPLPCPACISATSLPIPSVVFSACRAGPSQEGAPARPRVGLPPAEVTGDATLPLPGTA